MGQDNKKDDFLEEVLTVSLKGEIAEKLPIYYGQYERIKMTNRVKNFPIYKSTERKKGKWPHVYAYRKANGEMCWTMSIQVGGLGIIFSKFYKDEESLPKSPTLVTEWRHGVNMSDQNEAVDVSVTSSLQVLPEHEKPQELVWAGFGGMVRLYK